MKIAIVTGASSGMGREFVRQLNKTYADLNEIWVVARRKERMEELASEITVPIRMFVGDLLQKEIYEEIQSALAKEQAEVAILVNAAGFGKVGKVEDIACEAQLDMIDLNCISVTHMTKICIPYLKKNSQIINLASAASFCPQPSFSVYAATKSYVLSFSRSLRTELEDGEIHVTAVCPGPVETEFFGIAGKEDMNGIKGAVMVKAEAVVAKAICDARRNKAMSVYGLPMQLCRIATKIIPHGIILKLMKNVW